MKTFDLDIVNKYQSEIEQLLTTPGKRYTLISLKHAFARIISWQAYFKLLGILEAEKKIFIEEDGHISWSNNPKSVIYVENRRWTLDEINRLEQEYSDEFGAGSENVSTRIDELVYGE